MAIPARPVSGAPIDSTWGAGVHDQVFTPAGTVANSAVITTAAVKLKNPLTVGGPNLNAGDFLVPVDGLYLMIARWMVTPLGGMAWLRPSIDIDGVEQPPAGFSKSDVNGYVSERVHLKRLTAGQRVAFYASGSGASGAGVQVYVEIERLGDSLS